MIKANYRLHFFDKTVLFLNYFAAFAILISYLSPIVDPVSFWPIAFFGLAYLQLLLANVLFACYWLFRFKIQILISLVCILAGWQIMMKNVGFHKATTDGSKTSVNQIRMMAYNVHGFTHSEVPNQSTRHQILQIIHDQQPDIINIEEFYTKAKGKKAIRDSINKVLETQQYYFQPFSGTANDGAGLAIFSKFPIINQGVIRLTNDGSDTNAIFIDVTVNGKTIRVYCVHLQSFLLDAQDHGYVDSAQIGRADIHASRRIGSKLKTAFIRRSKQVKMIKKHLATCPYPFIIAGDFNDTPSSYVVNQMSAGLKNAFVEKGRGLGKTYNGDIPNYQIDYIMASPQFDIVNYLVIEKKLSDHYPVRSDLLLK